MRKARKSKSVIDVDKEIVNLIKSGNMPREKALMINIRAFASSLDTIGYNIGFGDNGELFVIDEEVNKKIDLLGIVKKNVEDDELDRYGVGEDEEIFKVEENKSETLDLNDLF